jgi:Fe-S-cluster containining protein
MPKSKSKPGRSQGGQCPTCGAKCCRYVVVEIAKPRDKTDRDEIRWFLSHENVLVFIDHDDNTWNVQFTTPCRHLGKDHRCDIYADRFDVCRSHETETCEASGGEIDAVIFRTAEEYDLWRAATKAKRRERKGKRRK